MSDQPDLFAPRTDPESTALLPPRAKAEPVAACAPSFETAPRTYGDVYYSFNVDTCPRCGARSDFVGVRRGRFSWAHPCAP